MTRQEMLLQIGSDDFGKVRAKCLRFVDKTLFIKEILDNNHVEVSVITRPRRFGKTFNLSTLHHFLANEVNQIKTQGMFDGLKISQVADGSYMQYQGKYPVVFISFKDAKDNTFNELLKSIQLIIQEMYSMHRYLLDSEKLAKDEKDVFKKFLVGEIDKATLEGSIKRLTGFLYKHTQKKVYLLIDEYDTPIQSGYSFDYYDEIIGLMRRMFGAALKTNPYLDRAVVTGILRIAKESIFSDLNNITVYSLLHSGYSQHFGFTEKEVKELLQEAGITEQEATVKKWYNGYVFGGTTVYNPWSIVNYINDRMLKPYWVNTSDNKLIRELLVKSNPDFKEQFEILLQGNPIEKIINENMVFGDLKDNSEAAWSLLLLSGYLKAVTTTIDSKGKTICECAIPNGEVYALYCDIIETWLGNGQGIGWYHSFLGYLLKGDIEKFEENFGQILAQTISVYDVAHNPEAFYHGFMLGLIAGVDSQQYELRSNRESGKGRYDIAIIPKSKGITKLKITPAIILEIKSIVPPKLPKKRLEIFLDKTLPQEAQKALKQINNNQYTLELVQRGFTNIIKIGLAFSGKEYRIITEKNR
jgi:hypothetical protein